MNVWILIPARGGSKGIPRKNVRLLAGKPLILHILHTLSPRFGRDTLIVSTDDDEIARLADPFARIHHRSPETADDASTLDDVAVEVTRWLLEQGARDDDIMLTVQPTSPLLPGDVVDQAVALFDSEVRSVISVRDDRHLRWTRDASGRAVPLYASRVNRQWLPEAWAETGGVIAARLGDIITSGTRVQPPIALLPLSAEAGLDIDSYADWAVADYYLSRRRIVIRADAGLQRGMGHVYRAVALAHELSAHDLHLATRSDGENALGAAFLSRHPFILHRLEDEAAFETLLTTLTPDLLLLDILDTTEAQMTRYQQMAGSVVALEDLGPGSRLADLVINDLYTDTYPQRNHWYGVQHAILNPQFETIRPKPFSETVESILIAFGGTDPQNLTQKAANALRQLATDAAMTVVLGPGYRHDAAALRDALPHSTIVQSVTNMAQLMRSADLALTSAGRTVTEFMTLGVPLLVMCQNNRELRHTHASSPHGVINLGLGQYVDVATLTQHIDMLLADADLRRDMRRRALHATQQRSNRDVVQRILAATNTE